MCYTKLKNALAGVEIRQASSAEEIEAARILFQEYAAALGINLDYQGFADELANLPGCYAPPRGRLLIAWMADEAAGCVALRPMADDVCEMKRLFVRPGHRGGGVGKLLAEAIVAEARQIGYATMRLDTIPNLEAATQLYETLGFARRDAYYDTPVAETIFMELYI
jgi:GNAT superfamily N-acetyltransferase